MSGLDILASATLGALAASFAADGFAKLSNRAQFSAWLRTGGIPVKGDSATRMVAISEIAVAASSATGPPGLLFALYLLAVTPIGVVLARRTGACACRGALKAATAAGLATRNLATVAVALAVLFQLNDDTLQSGALVLGAALRLLSEAVALGSCRLTIARLR